MPSPTRKLDFILFRCQFPRKPWCFCIVSLEKHFRMPPRNLFLSHFLVFTSFLIWYNHCLSGPLQLEKLCPWINSSPAARAHTQLASDVSGSWPEETSPEENWDVMILTLKWPLFLWGESWGSQCQTSWAKGSQGHLYHEFAHNHSYLHVLLWSLSGFSKTPCLTTL